jgi:hypothetical protein
LARPPTRTSAKSSRKKQPAKSVSVSTAPNPRALVKLGTKNNFLRAPRLGDSLDRILNHLPGKWAANLEQRRNYDAEQHLKAVQSQMSAAAKEKLSKEGLSNAQARAFEEAVSEASNFSFDSDPELSAVWRAAIEACFSNSSIASEVITALKSVETKALREFLQFNASGSTQNDDNNISQKSRVELRRVGILHEHEAIISPSQIVRFSVILSALLFLWMMIEAFRNLPNLIEPNVTTARPPTFVQSITTYIYFLYTPIILSLSTVPLLILARRYYRVRLAIKITKLGKVIGEGFQKYAVDILPDQAH